jgi:hypothetical protein
MSQERKNKPTLFFISTTWKIRTANKIRIRTVNYFQIPLITTWTYSSSKTTPFYAGIFGFVFFVEKSITVGASLRSIITIRIVTARIE